VESYHLGVPRAELVKAYSLHLLASARFFLLAQSTFTNPLLPSGADPP
jgi:hypothetical protein